jgi:CubicO group peptidase (beta-lactamase class C family)
MATWNPGKTDTTPDRAGYDDSRIKLLADYYGSLIDTGKIRAGGFLMARRGEIFAHQAAGKHTWKEDSPAIKADAIKRMASITKVFTAAAVMKLVEDGKLWLEQPVKDLIPEFDTKIHEKITLWHLLTHTSGLPADGGYFCEPYPVDWFGIINSEEWIKRLLSGPLQAKPGENWNYSTLGFSVLGEVVVRASGSSLEDYTEQEIFKPLGMTRSFFKAPAELKKEITSTKEWEAGDGDEFHGHKRHFTLGGFGAFSTLNDMFRFGQCFLNGGSLDGKRILGRKTVETMTRNQLDGVFSWHWSKECKNYRQGLGWGFFSDGPISSPDCFNHEGWGWCSLFVDPEEEFIYASFANDHTDWNPDVMVKPRTIAFSGIV